jgi:hypothetical protein
VIDVLSDLFIFRGVPTYVAQSSSPRRFKNGLSLLERAYIEPDGPWENGYRESPNAKLRDEVLNGKSSLHAQGGADPYRNLPAALQPGPSAFRPRLLSARPRGGARARRAIPASFPGHLKRGARDELERTFKPNRLLGAG